MIKNVREERYVSLVELTTLGSAHNSMSLLMINCLLEMREENALILSLVINLSQEK
jgi:hypothetical protein